MAAPFKRTRTKEIDVIVKEIIASIRKEMRSQHGNIKEVKVDVCLYGHGARPFGNYLPTDYRDVSIKVGSKEWNGLDNRDVFSLKYKLEDYTKEFDNVGTNDIFFSYGNFTPDVDDFPTTFRMFGKPCKEFKELAKLVNKKYGIILKIDDVYNVRLFGKGNQYGESGEREYAAFNETICAEYINKIKSFGRKKTIAKIGNNDDIDTDLSSRYLCECYGYRKHGLDIKLVL
jgi:hypothetical protein